MQFVNEAINKLQYESQNNYMLQVLVEKASNSANEKQAVEILKQGLESIPEANKTQAISEVIESCNQYLDLPESVESYVNEYFNEIDLVSKINEIRNDSNGVYESAPKLKYSLDKIEEYINDGTPQTRHISRVLETLYGYSFNDKVSEKIQEINEYIENNKNKLAVLETIDQLYVSNTTGAHDTVIEKLNNIVYEQDFNVNNVELELENYTNFPIVNNLINTLKAYQQTSEAELGQGNMYCEVKDLITPIKVNEDQDYSLIYNEGVVFEYNNKLVNRVPISEVSEKDSHFAQMCDDFNYLGFVQEGNRCYASFRDTSVDFVHKGGKLKLYLNETEVDKIEDQRINSLFAYETNQTKQALKRLLNENINYIGYTQGVKNLTNKHDNRNSTVFRIDEDQFYVYDHLPNTRTNKFYVNSYQLNKFLNENYAYDISNIYSDKINETQRKVNEIDSQISEYKSEISELENSIEKIDNAVDEVEDKEYYDNLYELRNEIEDTILKHKDSIKNLEREKSSIANVSEQEDSPTPSGVSTTDDDFQIGDEVKVEPDGKKGKIISVNDANNEYMIYLKDGSVVNKKADDISSADSGSEDEDINVELSDDDDDDKGKSDKGGKKKTSTSSPIKDEEYEDEENTETSREEVTIDENEQTELAPYQDAIYKLKNEGFKFFFGSDSHIIMNRNTNQGLEQVVVNEDGKVNEKNIDDFLNEIESIHKHQNNQINENEQYSDKVNQYSTSYQKQSQLDQIKSHLEDLRKQLSESTPGSDKSFYLQSEVDRLTSYVNEMEQHEYEVQDLEGDAIYKVTITDDEEMIRSANPYSKVESGDELFVAKAGDFYIMLPIDETADVTSNIIPKHLISEVEETYTYHDGGETDNESVDNIMQQINYNYEFFNKNIKEAVNKLQQLKTETV